MVTKSSAVVAGRRGWREAGLPAEGHEGPFLGDWMFHILI